MSPEETVMREHTGTVLDAVTIDPRLASSLLSWNDLEEDRLSRWKPGGWRVPRSAQCQRSCPHPHPTPDLGENLHVRSPCLPYYVIRSFACGHQGTQHRF